MDALIVHIATIVSNPPKITTFSSKIDEKVVIFCK
jgi:hypothetical protein